MLVITIDGTATRINAHVRAFAIQHGWTEQVPATADEAEVAAMTDNPTSALDYATGILSQFFARSVTDYKKSRAAAAAAAAEEEASAAELAQLTLTAEIQA